VSDTGPMGLLLHWSNLISICPILIWFYVIIHDVSYWCLSILYILIICINVFSYTVVFIIK